MNAYWKKFSEFEDELRRKFLDHGIYTYLHGWTDDQFRQYLLQIGFIAREFVKWYEIAKLGLDDERAKEVVRTILRDEIPRDAPTHQDNRLHDLRLMGVTKEQVLNAKASPESEAAIRQLYLLVRVPQEHQDLLIMVGLRIAGEVLVSEQYNPIVLEMERRFGISPNQSKFFAPHWIHDMKGGMGWGHTDEFDEVLASMIVDDATLKEAKLQARVAFNIRYGMQDQFLPARKVPHVTHLG